MDNKKFYPSDENEKLNTGENNEDYFEYTNNEELPDEENYNANYKEVVEIENNNYPYDCNENNENNEISETFNIDGEFNQDENYDISSNEENNSSVRDRPFIEEEMDIEVPYVPYTKDFIPKGVDKQKLLKEVNKEKERQELLKEIEEMQKEVKAKKENNEKENNKEKKKLKKLKKEKKDGKEEDKSEKKKKSSPLVLGILIVILIAVSTVFFIKKVDIDIPAKLEAVFKNTPISGIISEIFDKNDPIINPSPNNPNENHYDDGTNTDVGYTDETGTTDPNTDGEIIDPDLELLNMIKAKVSTEVAEGFEYEVAAVHIETEKISIDITKVNSADMLHLNRMVQAIQKILLDFVKPETKYIEVNLSVGNAKLTWNTPERVVKFISELSYIDRHSSQFWWDMTEVYKNNIYYKNSMERKKLYVNSPHPVWNIEENIEEQEKQISLLSWNKEFYDADHSFKMYYPEGYEIHTNSSLINYKYVKIVPAYKNEANYIESMELFLYDKYYGTPLRRLEEFEKANRERIRFSSILNANHKIDYGLFKETSNNGNVTYIYYFVGNSNLGDYDLIVRLTKDASANLDKAMTDNLVNNISRIDFALIIEEIEEDETSTNDTTTTDTSKILTDLTEEKEKTLNLPDLSKFAEEKEQEHTTFKIGN